MTLPKIVTSFLYRRAIPRFHRCRSTHVNGFVATAESISSPTQMVKNTSTPQELTESKFIHGETLNLAADLRTFRPGDKLEIPYELTVTESIQEFWQSVRTSLANKFVLGTDNVPFPSCNVEQQQYMV